MHILISPNESHPLGQGVRIADIAGQPFEVAAPLFWIECPEGVTPHSHYYDMKAGQCVKIPQPTLPPQPDTNIPEL